MLDYLVDQLVTEGKTKEIWGVKGVPGLVIAQYKNAITAHNDPKYTKEFSTKAEHSNTINCRVFELLRRKGIFAAFLGQISATKFIALRCDMISLEVVARGRAAGKYIKRFPNTKTLDGDPPMLFPEPIIEFFLKTTGGRLVGKNGDVLVDGLPPEIDDPWIINPMEEDWNLFHSALPPGTPGANLGISVRTKDVVPAPAKNMMIQMRDVFTKVFVIVRDAWEKLFGFHLLDMKGEFGIDPAGILRLSDVLDNDSWRLRTRTWEEVSKEGHRQGKDLGEVEQDYALVAHLVEKFSTLW